MIGIPSIARSNIRASLACCRPLAGTNTTPRSRIRSSSGHNPSGMRPPESSRVPSMSATTSRTPGRRASGRGSGWGGVTASCAGGLRADGGGVVVIEVLRSSTLSLSDLSVLSRRRCPCLRCPPQAWAPRLGAPQREGRETIHVSSPARHRKPGDEGKPPGRRCVRSSCTYHPLRPPRGRRDGGHGHVHTWAHPIGVSASFG